MSCLLELFRVHSCCSSHVFCAMHFVPNHASSFVLEGFVLMQPHTPCCSWHCLQAMQGTTFGDTSILLVNAGQGSCACQQLCLLSAGLQLDVLPHSTAQHSMSLCFLAQGVYTLYAYDIHQSPENNAANQSGATERKSFLGVTAVSQAYFLVE